LRIFFKINLIFLHKNKHNITCTPLHYNIACSAKIVSRFSLLQTLLTVAPLTHCLDYGAVNKHRLLEKEEETTGQKYNGLPYYIGRP